MLCVMCTMCRVERPSENNTNNKCELQEYLMTMGLKFNNSKLMKHSPMAVSQSRVKLWMIRAITSILLWTCVVQLMALGEMWGPRLLKGWPSCFSHNSDLSLAAQFSPLPAKIVLPPKSKFNILLLSILFLEN